MSETSKIVDAIAEWDDAGAAFRVYLVREDADGEPDIDNAEPMEAVLFDGGEVECRLFKAVFCANPKDFRGHVHSRDLGFDKKTKAERAARAVKKELARIAKGEPGPDMFAMQIAVALAGDKR